jgi:hypothetical protein
MPWTNALPPDTRAVGTGNPPVDMNAVSEAFAASGATFNLQNPIYGGADPGTASTPGADCSTAFAACMAAAIAANGEMVIPPGNYTVNTGPFHITGPFRMRGIGSGLNNGGTLVPAVRLNSNTSGNMFDFPFQGYGWGGLEVFGVSINFTGTGNVWSGMNFGDAVWRDMDITLTASGSQAMVTSGSVSFLNILHERCNFTTTNPVRTKPMISISSTIPAAVSNCTFFKCKFTNKGCDNTQYMVYFDCSTASGIAYHYMDNFRECWFEQPFGGAYKCLAGQNITVDACMVWDIFSGPTTTVAAASNGGTISNIAAWANPSPGVLSVANAQFFNPAGGTGVQVATSGTQGIISYTGVSGNTLTGCTFTSGSGTVSTGGSVVLPITVGNSTFYFGQFAGGANTQGVRITGCGRSQAGPNGSTAWDVETEVTTSQVYIQGWINKPASVSTQTNAFFNFHGCNDVILMGNQSPQGANINGNSGVVITNPSPNQLAISEAVITPAPLRSTGFGPEDLSYQAWTYDPLIACGSGGDLLTSGTVYVNRVQVPVSITATNLVVFVVAAGVTLTSGQSLLGLYNSAGTRIGITADQSAIWTSTGTKSAALVGGPFVLSPGFYWIAFLNVNTGTSPKFARFGNNTLTATIGNIGANATSNMRFGTNVTAQTALPSPLVLASNAASGVSWWAGIT